MTAEVLVPWLTSQFFSNNGQFLAGGQLFSYAAGTSTPIATFSDSTGLNVNTNPVIANSRGEMSVWITSNVLYKFVLEDASGNTIWTRDQVSSTQLLSLNGGSDTGSASLYILNFLSPFTTLAAFTGTPIFFVAANNSANAASINVNGLGIVGLFNGDGSPIGQNQIIAGQMQEIVYQTNIGGSGNSGFVLFPGTSLTGSATGTFGKEAPIASATTTDLGTLPAHTGLVTGTTTITGFGSSASLLAPYYLIRFSGSLTLTNSPTLTLPGNANIVTQSGDALLAQYLGSGAWKVTAYFSATGTLNNSKIKPGDTVITNSSTLTPDPDLQSNALTVGRYSYELMLIFDSVAGGAGFKFQNDGTAVDSRALSPVIETGLVNGAADGPKQSTFYSAPISYAAVSTAANSNQAIYKGSLLVSTPGTFGIQWAQNSATASATTLRAGSYLTMNLLNTGTSSGVVTRVNQTPGTFTETVPTGFNTLTIECWGGSSAGGTSFGSGLTLSGGGGGGSGGYSRTTVSVTGLGGDTLNYTVGAVGFLSTVSSGTLAITTITANPGINGGAAVSAAVAGTGGAAGTSTGGTVVNTPGNAGANGQNAAGGSAGGQGGFGVPGIFDGGNGGGRGGGLFPSTAGGVGIVVFSYSS
jgi:hypothetical protein